MQKQHRNPKRKDNFHRLSYCKYPRIPYILSLFIAFISSSNSVLPAQTKPQQYYICTGDFAKCYHCDFNCPGLNNCNADIILLTDSLKHKYIPCSICAKHSKKSKSKSKSNTKTRPKKTKSKKHHNQPQKQSKRRDELDEMPY